jgi:hypothetical protein
MTDYQQDRYTIRPPKPALDRYPVVAVTQRSPMSRRRAAERFAYYFKREFGYDRRRFAFLKGCGKLAEHSHR